MKVALVALGAIFAAGAVLLAGMLVAGELFPYTGGLTPRRWLFPSACIGLTAAVSLFFFRWALNVERSNGHS